jgi:hypothetical protein
LSIVLSEVDLHVAVRHKILVLIHDTMYQGIFMMHLTSAYIEDRG